MNPRVLILSALSALPATAQTTEFVSNAPDGSQADGTSRNAVVSGNGRYVAFESLGGNLVAGDVNGDWDVFVLDRATGAIQRASTTTFGVGGGPHPSRNPSISYDGRYVAFESESPNLAPLDVNGAADVFVKDTQTGVLVRASVQAGGLPASGASSEPSLDDSGLWVSFRSDAGNLPGGGSGWTQIFLKNWQTGELQLVSGTALGAGGNGDSWEPCLSPDGRRVAFTSEADDLLGPGADTNSYSDVYVHDRVLKKLWLASSAADGSAGVADAFHPSLSLDGSVVAFAAIANNLLPGDENKTTDVYVRDLDAGVLVRASLDANGVEHSGPINQPCLSRDGDRVLFDVQGDGFGPADFNDVKDVYQKTLSTGAVLRVSVQQYGNPSLATASRGSMSADGTLFTFDAYEGFLNGDANGVLDVAARILEPALHESYGEGHAGTLGVPQLSLSQDPVLASTTAIQIGNSLGAPTSGLVAYGPFQFLAPTPLGGELLVFQAQLVPVELPPGTAEFPWSIPDNPNLLGAELFWQAFVVDPGASHGVAFTPGLRTVLGH